MDQGITRFEDWKANKCNSPFPNYHSLFQSITSKVKQQFQSRITATDDIVIACKTCLRYDYQLARAEYYYDQTFEQISKEYATHQCTTHKSEMLAEIMPQTTQSETDSKMIDDDPKQDIPLSESQATVQFLIDDESKYLIELLRAEIDKMPNIHDMKCNYTNPNNFHSDSSMIFYAINQTLAMRMKRE